MKRAYTLIEILVVIAILAVLIALVFPVLASARAKARTSQCSAQMRQIGQAMQLYSADYDCSLPTITIGVFVDHHASSPVTWRTLLQTYITGSSFPACPEVNLPARMQEFKGSTPVCGYAYNGRLGSTVKITMPNQKPGDHYVGVSDSVLSFSALTVTVIEARPGILACRAPDSSKEVHGIWSDDFTAEIEAQTQGARRHTNGANYLFADGHLKWLTPEKLKTGRTSDGIHPGFGL